MTSEVVSDSGHKWISQSNKSALRNPWVLGWLILVVVVLGVNIGMVTMAIVSNPGLVDKNYYEQGQEYENNMLKRLAERNSLGWKTDLELPRRSIVAIAAPFRLDVTDKDGQPLRGADVELVAYRPSDASADFKLPMHENAPGSYVADVTFKLKGIWELRAKIVQGDRNFEVVRRVSVQAP